MKCMDALDALLTADLRSTAAGGELAEHLRTCSRCHAIAAQLRRDSAVLASVVSAVPLTVTPTATRTPVRALQGAALALAALLVAVFLPSRVAERFADATPQGRPGQATRSTQSAEQRALSSAEVSAVERVAIAPGGPNGRVAAGGSAARQMPAVDVDRSMHSLSAADARGAELGVPIPAPMPVEAMAILPMVITLDDVTEEPAPALAASSRHKLVLLPQSNPHVTVFWVY